MKVSGGGGSKSNGSHESGELLQLLTCCFAPLGLGGLALPMLTTKENRLYPSSLPPPPPITTTTTPPPPPPPTTTRLPLPHPFAVRILTPDCKS